MTKRRNIKTQAKKEDASKKLQKLTNQPDSSNITKE